MKNLKVQFKLIVYIFLFLNTFIFVSAKTSDKFSNAKDISNYFSGVLATNDNQYEKSYSFFKSLNNLEDNHLVYPQYYQYSLVSLNKFRDAAKYSKKLKDKKIDNFESNLISVVYQLKNKNFENALLYLKQMDSEFQPGTIQNLLYTSLNTWINFNNISDLDSGLKLLDAIPENFKYIKNIQKTFAYCYFNSSRTNEMFKQLTSNPNVNYSRYNFFHSNYLISKNLETPTKKIIKLSLEKYPKNLILNQLKLDFEKKKRFNNKFDCKNITDVIAEIFYIASNALAAQNNLLVSNFHLNIAKYLNPNFVSFEALHAENFLRLQENEKAKKIYHTIKKKGSVYNWYASKQIASILIQQDKKKDAVISLKETFEEIVNPTIYQLFDYAEFLKNNEKFKESIKFYTMLLTLIDTTHVLYPKIMDGRGVAYERSNQWNKAEIDLLSSLNATPDNAYAINYLAYSWIEKGTNIKKALDMLKKANRLKPNDGYITDSLGWALFKLKDYKEAKLYLEMAIKNMASDPVVNDHYADALWMNNKKLQARYYWSYVLKLEKIEEKLKKSIEKKLLFGLKS